MLTRKEIIDKIMENNSTTKTGIAKDLGIGRQKIYDFIKGKNEELIAVLLTKFVDAFTEEEYKEIDSSLDEDFFEPKPKKDENKSTVIAVSQASETSVEEKKSGGTKYITPSHHLRSKNLRCRTGCYFIKVPIQYLEIARPSCPICNEEMYTKQERKEKGWES